MILDGEQATPVPGDVIADVARCYAVGTSRLKSVLEEIETSEDLEDLEAGLADAARKALEMHGEYRTERARIKWMGQTVRSEEFDAPVTIQAVHDPTIDEVVAEIQPVDVELPDGQTETTHMGSLVTDGGSDA